MGPLSRDEEAELAILDDLVAGYRFGQLATLMIAGLTLVTLAGLALIALGQLAMACPLATQLPTLLLLGGAVVAGFQSRARPERVVLALRLQAAWWWSLLVTGLVLAFALGALVVSTFAVF